MTRTLRVSGAVAAIALLLAGAAGAATGSFGALEKSARSLPGQIALARHGGPMMGMHVHGLGPHVGLHAYSSPHIHHHLHRRFLFVGVPYYDYGYDYAYDPDCWWSRRYHRWVCPSY